jgi:hypothetical protein
MATANEVKPAMPTPVPVEKEEFTLPFSGRQVLITSRRLKGLDLVNARRQTKENDQAKDVLFTYALWSSVLENPVTGRRMVVEDLLEMDSVDLAALGEKLSSDSRFQQPGEAVQNSTPPSPVS